MFALVICSTSAKAQEADAGSGGGAEQELGPDAECSPKCKLGFDCMDGVCKPMPCTPTCRSGFTCVEGECKSECDPTCRSGFICIHGECKSPCNPPCGQNERCTDDHECVRLHAASSSDDDARDDDDEAKGTAAKSSAAAASSSGQQSIAEKYTPSVTRIYVGPMMLAASIGNGPLLTDPGGTFAADFHPDDARVLFLGFRVGGWGDPSGAAILFDIDLGLRPRLWTGSDAAVSLSLGGGVGVAYFTSISSALFHLPMRVGPCFDFGAFTFEVLGGPALYAAAGAVGSFEGIAEIGARFGN